MRRIGKAGLKDLQVLDQEEMKNVRGGSGIDNESGHYGCINKIQGEDFGGDFVSGFCVGAEEEDIYYRYR